MSPKAQKVVKQLTADKKKLSLMICLVAVMLLLWGRLILKQVPRTANAKSPSTSSSTVESKDSDKDESIRTAKGSAELPVVKLELPQSMTRDLFAFDKSFYPSAAEEKEPEEELSDEQKSGSDSTDVDDGAERIRDLSSDLTLQTTILGSRPRAVINGRVMGKGEAINGLTVREIHSRSVILEMGGHRVRLEM